MSDIKNNNFDNWIAPVELEAAVIKNEINSKTYVPPSAPVAESSKDSTVNQKTDLDNKGIDMSLLLSLLGNQIGEQNSAIKPLLGLLGSEKPDILTLLPMLLSRQASTKTENKESTKTKQSSDSTINLDDYTRLN